MEPNIPNEVSFSLRNATVSIWERLGRFTMTEKYIVNDCYIKMETLIWNQSIRNILLLGYFQKIH